MFDSIMFIIESQVFQNCCESVLGHCLLKNSNFVYHILQKVNWVIFPYKPRAFCRAISDSNSSKLKISISPSLSFFICELDNGTKNCFINKMPPSTIRRDYCSETERATSRVEIKHCVPAWYLCLLHQITYHRYPSL